VREIPPPGAPEDALPEGPGRALIGEIETMLDRDELSDELLEDLGTSRQALRRLLEEYGRLLAEEAAGPGEPAPGQPRDAGRVLEGAVVAAPDMSIKDGMPAEPRRDLLRSRFEGVTERLSAHYRDQVSEYYQALSEER